MHGPALLPIHCASYAWRLSFIHAACMLTDCARAVGHHTNVADERGGVKKTVATWLKAKHVPYIMAARDFLEPLAVGMSAKCGLRSWGPLCPYHHA